jgi:hypothetical protein
MQKLHHRLFAIVWFGIFTATLHQSPIAFAADPKSVAVTDPAQADSDYRLQGEYYGHVSSAPCCATAIGLQVIALGGGKFDAIQFAGGLPGNAWNRREKWALKPELKNGWLTLIGDSHQFVIRGAGADVYDKIGRPLGRLQQVIRESPSIGACPPEGALVLFDGTSASHFVNGKVTEQGLLAEGADTKQSFGDFFLHLEFQTPYMPQARGQGRGNSGVYIQGRYEVQVLDSFGLKGEDNECGGVYKTKAPDLNMCLPPLVWQSYDIHFAAPKFDKSGKKTANARLTVRHNDVLVQNDIELPNKTGGGSAEGPDRRPLKLQNHGNPVRFRNIWMIENPWSGSCPPDSELAVWGNHRQLPLGERVVWHDVRHQAAR